MNDVLFNSFLDCDYTHALGATTAPIDVGYSFLESHGPSHPPVSCPFSIRAGVVPFVWGVVWLEEPDYPYY